MWILITGIVAGFLHVLSGPDHLAAVAPLSAREHRRAWLVGLRWGVGHSSGVVVVAVLACILKNAAHIQWFSALNEGLVGVALILIGAWGLYGALSHHIHVHTHRHGGDKHVHVHGHEHNHLGMNHSKRENHIHMKTALGVGILHGLAGSSHLLGVLPALGLPTWTGTGLYLGAFALGTILAMMLFASTIGWLSRWNLFANDHSYHLFLGALSLGSVGVGIHWIIRSGWM